MALDLIVRISFIFSPFFFFFVYIFVLILLSHFFSFFVSESLVLLYLPLLLVEASSAPCPLLSFSSPIPPLLPTNSPTSPYQLPRFSSPSPPLLLLLPMSGGMDWYNLISILRNTSKLIDRCFMPTML